MVDPPDPAFGFDLSQPVMPPPESPDPGWVMKLAWGTLWLLIGTVLVVPVTCIASFSTHGMTTTTFNTPEQGGITVTTSTTTVNPFVIATNLVPLAVMFVGYWLLTTPTSNTLLFGSARNLRRLARWSAILALLLAALSNALIAVPRLWWLMLLMDRPVRAAAEIVTLFYLALLVERIAAKGALAKQARIIALGMIAGYALMLLADLLAHRPGISFSGQQQLGLITLPAILLLFALAVWKLVLLVLCFVAFQTSARSPSGRG